LKFIISLVGALCVTGSLATSGRAQQPASPEQLTAAHELFVVMRLEPNLNASIERLVDAQVKQNPLLEPYRKHLLDYFSEQMSWARLKDDMARFYAEEFTLEDLRRLADFYRTPLGEKAASRIPRLNARCAELGMKHIQENMADLEKRIQQESRKNDDASSAATRSTLEKRIQQESQ